MSGRFCRFACRKKQVHGYDRATISRGWLYEQKEKDENEYRFYEVPEKCPVLALLGEKWVQNYGYQIDYLHFHNMMEIGVCYYG